MANRALLRLLHSDGVALGIVFVAALMRLVPHIPNMTPIGAMALFGGAHLQKKYGLFLPLGAMVLSDLFLGFSQTTPYVYGGFVLIWVIGTLLRTRSSAGAVLAAAVLSSTLFFLITNFGVWLTSSLYPKTFAGQLDAYVMGLSFFRNTLVGDLFYTTLFFGGYMLVSALVKRHEQAKNL